jgi:4-amino-4-deoxy-L-arabinose transferase-like glycosyltransferase
MTAADLARLTRNRFERIFDALVDPLHGEWVMVLMLGGYAVTWALYATIAKSSQDIHPDMAEMAAWSRQLVLGTPKHPPLGSWLLHAWFSVFPRTDWSYYLFAMILPAVALWITWRISGRYLPRDKRVTGLALLTLVPFYNFHALKFNANAVLTPFWAVTTWWFLLSFETRRVGWAVLAGIGGAAAMLGKYWSAILVAALGLAALTDPRRDGYFRSPAPYVSLAVGTILLTPHVNWMIASQFAPLTYAFEGHPASYLTAAESALDFIGSSLAYIAAPVVFSLIAAQPSVAAIADTLWPSEPERRIVVAAFAMPFLLAVVVAVLFKVHVEALWAISMTTLLPVVLFSSSLVTIPRGAGIIATAVATIFPLVMVVVSPVVAIVVHRVGVDNYQDQYQLAARALESSWQKQTGEPLQIVGSYSSLVNGAAFYIAGRPATLDLYGPALTPWVDDESIQREGMAMICPESMYACMRMLEGYGAHYHATAAEHVMLARSYLGEQGAPVPYEIVIIPPRTQ